MTGRRQAAPPQTIRVSCPSRTHPGRSARPAGLKPPRCRRGCRAAVRLRTSDRTGPPGRQGPGASTQEPFWRWRDPDRSRALHGFRRRDPARAPWTRMTQSCVANRSIRRGIGAASEPETRLGGALPVWPGSPAVDGPTPARRASRRRTPSRMDRNSDEQVRVAFNPCAPGPTAVHRYSRLGCLSARPELQVGTLQCPA